MIIKTKKGYDLYVIASGLQKAIRRANPKLACYCGLELFSSGYNNYLWKRLLTISAEDIYDTVTKEIWSLYQSFLLIKKSNKKENSGRLFITKAILILCRAKKSRDADNFNNLLYDVTKISETEIKQFANANEEKIEMPEYVYDCHTREGKRKGKTKKDFFKIENQSLFPKEKGEFDYLVN